jgi:hypothetical protein
MSARRERKTSRYSLVVHEVSTTSVNIWVGALLPSIAKPKNWALVVKQVDNGFANETASGDKIKRIEHLSDDKWLRPFKALNKRFYQTQIMQELTPGQDYLIEFEVRHDNKWQVLETAFFTTLPASLSTSSKAPFTVGIGSCFYTKHDGGRAGRAYEALYKSEQYKPDIKFLAGDQVYVDIGLGLYPLDEEDCQTRIADDYAESWELLRSMLRRGGTWLLPDDHEYWNNYPYLKGFNPYLITLGLNDDFRDRWEAAAKMGVDSIQQVKTIRTFTIGDDLSFCVADLRSERGKQGFVSPQGFAELQQWVKNLNSPGVLIIPQPLIAGEGNKDDANLPDWSQYQTLLEAMQAGDHDIVVLTGDVHYGRVAEVKIGNSRNKLVEVITSPISNLSELDGIAADVPDLSAKTFPMVDLPSVSKNTINYLGKITTQSRWWDLRFPVKRTTEHFMTVDFYRDGGGVKMKLHAWNAREIQKRSGLPKKIKGFNIKPIRLK